MLISANWEAIPRFVKLAAALALLTILSGVFIRRQKYRTFSLVIAGLSCLMVPFGTVLGVFTLVILSRESVRQLYLR